MRYKYLIILLFIFCTSSYAQQQYYSGITYNLGIPLSKTKDFVGDLSYRGLTIEGGRFMNKNISIGGSVGWNLFSEQITDLIQLQSGAVSGTQRRHINSFFIFGYGRYNFDFGRGSKVKPYVGVNVGTYYIDSKFEIGVYEWINSNWHFGFAPEVGLIFPAGKHVELFTNVKYNYALDAGETLTGDSNNDYSYLSVSIGAGFSMW
jgi:hypothetical protein